VRRRPQYCGRVGTDECVAGHSIARGLEQPSASQNRVLHPPGQRTTATVGGDGPGDVFEVADEMLDEDEQVRETMIQTMLGDKEAKDICQENINLALESAY
jgi:hypothetical protein